MASFTSAVTLFILAAITITPFISAQSCPANPTPTNSIQTSLAAGFISQVVATGLSKPRSLEFDAAGNLLVLEQGKGLTSFPLVDAGGVCVTLGARGDLVENSDLTHGLALSPDSSTVYVSTSDAVYIYSYNATTRTISNTTSNNILVTGMANADHTTRTILYPRRVDGVLVISRGSGGNLDLGAADESSGISQVKAFNLSGVPKGGYNFAADGVVLGWGLRNDVGVVEHPTTGGIWAVENSFDELERNGADVHENNPGEELNFLGYLNGTSTAQQGTSFGYPYCFTAWEPSALPENVNISVGTPFAQSSQNDSICARTTPPRLTFASHLAPLDIKFNDSANTAWMSSHGSWDRTMPIGYFVGTIAFGPDGEPVEPPTSNTSLTTIFSNVDNTRCPGNCFRPVGMAFDTLGRLFVASDASGEIYVIMRDDAQMNATISASSTSVGGSMASSMSTPAASGSTAPANGGSMSGLTLSTAGVGLACMLFTVLLV